MATSFLEDPFVLLFSFLIASAGVLVLSFLFSESIKGILNRFQLSEKFVGSSLLASGTSFPEVINAITAGFYDKEEGDQASKFKYSIDSFYNLTGASLIQIFFLSSLSVVLYNLKKKRKFAESEYQKFINSTLQKKTLLWFLFTLELTILLIAIALPDYSRYLNIGSFNSLPFLFFFIWIFYLIFFTKKGKEDCNNYSNIFDKLGNTKFVIVFGLIFACFSILSFLNFNIVTKFEKTFHIPRNIGLGTLLSLVTSFPEFSSFYFLFRTKNFSLANTGIFGSASFNLLLPSLTQLIKGEWFLSELSTNSDLKFSLMCWLILSLALNLVFLVAFYTNKKGNCILNLQYSRWNVSWSLVLMTIYLVCSFLIFPIFLQSNTAKIT